jgi:hypothetical protein
MLWHKVLNAIICAHFMRIADARSTIKKCAVVDGYDRWTFSETRIQTDHFQ